MSNEPTITLEFIAFKDGVYDAVVHGISEGGYSSPTLVHYYKRGYDFGLTLLRDMFVPILSHDDELENEDSI